MKPLRILLLALASFVSSPAAAREETPGLLVNPFVGTLADFGQLSPAAVAPFGMVQLGPDTSPGNHAGYDFGSRHLLGFSHTRGVGVGCGGAGGDLLVALDYVGQPAPALIDKTSERAHAGRYSVRYGGGIVATMTATRGAGIIRFALPADGTIQLRLDSRHAYSKRRSSRWLTPGWDDLQAELVAGTVCDVGLYRLFTSSRLTHNGRPVRKPVHTVGGVAEIALRVKKGDAIELRTGLSTVDGAGAAKVREHEVGNRPAAAVEAQTLGLWNGELSRISLDAGRGAKALFYTSLFRALQTPVAIADPDGRYRGSDGQERRLPPGSQRYTNWAMWDNYRTLMPLLALAYPDRAVDIASSLTELYGEGKHRWGTQTEPFLTVRTEHSGVALLDFHRKGIRFDANAALAGMAAESPGLARSTPDEQIEAAYDDWAIAELATDLGNLKLASDHRNRALQYRKMWRETFMDLGADADVVKARGLYQGTLWQYRWAPVFDLDWLVETLGGDRFDRELQRFFSDDLYNMTNQPDIHAPYLFAWRGRPASTETIVGRLLNEPVNHPYTNAGKRPVPWYGRSFSLSPQGFADGMDDDAGGMSSWYVFATLGLYPLTPGKPEYVTFCPQHRKARIAVPGRKPLVIRRVEGGRTAAGAAQASRSPIVAHQRLLEGGELPIVCAAH